MAQGQGEDPTTEARDSLNDFLRDLPTGDLINVPSTISKRLQMIGLRLGESVPDLPERLKRLLRDRAATERSRATLEISNLRQTPAESPNTSLPDYPGGGTAALAIDALPGVIRDHIPDRYLHALSALPSQ